MLSPPPLADAPWQSDALVAPQHAAPRAALEGPQGPDPTFMDMARPPHEGIFLFIYNEFIHL